MVDGLRASDTAGTSVSQWADTAMMAVGLGSCLPSEARKARAGTSSRINVGDPCDTKIVGMDIALFLIQGFSSIQGKASMVHVLWKWAAAVCIALLAAAPASAQTLKMVAHSDLKVLDPIWTTAFITRNHGYLIYDTLFAKDEELRIRPQMVDTYETSPDKLTWTFTLRDGLEWHDGSPVTAEDCVASIKRWAPATRLASN